MREMTILVTGGAGYIGSHMTHRLKDLGEDVVVLDNLSTGFVWALPEGVKLIEGNTGDEALLAQLFKDHEIEAVVHFAASIVVPDSVADPLGYYRNNTSNARSLIEAAVNGGVKHFIFSSTAATYGMVSDAPVTEDTPVRPMSPYGSSKLMTETILRDVSAVYPMSHVVLRYFNVAGADPQGRVGQSTPNATHLIKVAAQTALGQRPQMSVFGTDYPTPDGTCLRDYIHVMDLIEAHVMALKHLRAGGASDTFNCGYGKGYSVLEVIKAVKQVSNVDFKVEFAPRRAGDPAAIVANSDKIQSMLKWSPQYADLNTIVEHAYAWVAKLQALGPKTN
jgi:UDP-glucose 4-epimerase